MRKRFLSAVLALMMLCSLLSACGSGESGTDAPASGTPSTENEEPYTITMMFIGNVQDDEEKVEAAINELTMRDLNMKLDILVVPWANAGEQQKLMLSGGEKLDLMLGQAAQASSLVSTKAVCDLSGLIDQYGANIKANMGDKVKVASIDNFVYGIPVVCDWYWWSSVLVRTDWMEEAGFSKEDVRTVEDLEKLYEAVSKNHPEASMLAMSKGQKFDSDWRLCDPLGDGYGVLLDYGAEPVVENWFASDDYSAFVHRQYEWAQKGWISKDAATTTDYVDAQIANGKAFSTSSTNQPSIENEASTSYGIPMTCIPLYERYTTTSLNTSFYWTVAHNSEYPEKAFQMLDYIYGSPEVTNLLNWGIEGEHYVLTGDGHATFPEGMDKASDPYNAYFGFQLPNQYEAHPWEGAPADAGEQIKELNDTAKRSCAYGFVFDSTDYATELAALDNVKAQYIDALNTGAVDPDTVLPEFLKSLEDAGINKIIEAKQQQLNDWLAQQ